MDRFYNGRFYNGKKYSINATLEIERRGRRGGFTTSTKMGAHSPGTAVKFSFKTVKFDISMN